MPTAVLESLNMAKRTEKPADEMTDPVRYTGVMERDDRNRFKAFCALTGQDMEIVGPRWIMDRLAEEQAKPADAKPPARGRGR
jgi:hypothetical protein